MCSDSQPAAHCISAADIRRQVWRSVISMVRVYASLESIRMREPIHLTETTMHSAAVEIGSVRLELIINLESGWGGWRLAGEAGEFAISDSGLLLVDREQKELDIAAMEWLDKLFAQYLRPLENRQLSESIPCLQNRPPDYDR